MPARYGRASATEKRHQRRIMGVHGSESCARDGIIAASGTGETTMSDQPGDDDFVYDEASGEWISAKDAAAKSAGAGQVEVRDSVGNLLANGDSVTLIKDLTVKGAGQTLRRGTVIKSIRLTGDDQEIDCRYEGIKGLVLRAEFVKKR
jgi:protein PhnA